MHKLSTMARAKLVPHQKFDTYRLVVAFNVYDTNKNGVYQFPVAKRCDYVSGDLLASDVLAALELARVTLRTHDIDLVGEHWAAVLTDQELPRRG